MRMIIIYKNDKNDSELKGYGMKTLIDCGNSFAIMAENKSSANANCGSLVVKAWGTANAHEIAAELTMSMEAMGAPMGINSLLESLKIQCDEATKSQRPFQVIVEHASLR